MISFNVKHPTLLDTKDEILLNPYKVKEYKYCKSIHIVKRGN